MVLETYPDGRPKKRVFVAHENHEAYRNDPRMAGNPGPMTVAIHGHQARITLTRLYGRPMQVDATLMRCKDGDSGPYRLAAWKYQSQILTGKAGFVQVAPAVYLDIFSPREFDRIEMQPWDLHTVFIEQGETAAWLVEEHELSDSYDPTCFSNADLSQFDGAGMYQPMSSEELEQFATELLKNMIADKLL